MLTLFFIESAAESVKTGVTGDAFVFYRSTDRVVRNGRVVCALSQIDRVLLGPPVMRGSTAALLLALKDRTEIKVDASVWGDLPGVAERLAAFVKAEVVDDEPGPIFG